MDGDLGSMWPEEGDLHLPRAAATRAAASPPSPSDLSQKVERGRAPVWLPALPLLSARAAGRSDRDGLPASHRQKSWACGLAREGQGQPSRPPLLLPVCLERDSAARGVPGRGGRGSRVPTQPREELRVLPGRQAFALSPWSPGPLCPPHNPSSSPVPEMGEGAGSREGNLGPQPGGDGRGARRAQAPESPGAGAGQARSPSSQAGLHTHAHTCTPTLAHLNF